MLASGVAKARPGRTRARPKQWKHHARPARAREANGLVPGQYQLPGYATDVI